MRSVFDFLVKQFIVIAALVVCFDAGAEGLAQTRFGKLSFDASLKESQLSIKWSDKVVLQRPDYISAELFAVQSLQDKDYVIIGLGVMGNCCPWLDVVVVEVSASGAVAYDTETDIYLETKPELQVKEGAIEITLTSSVSAKPGENIKFVLKDSKLSGPISIKKPIKAFSGKDCSAMFDIYVAECSGEYSADDCSSAGLQRFQEIDFLVQRNASDSRLFYDHCSDSCGAAKLTGYKDFSAKVCNAVK
ncbi:MAG TPA: hypothetical protein VN030_01390 [Cellvibrio sp.]|nr:hypothetical protein [Cellvibrio sp.]